MNGQNLSMSLNARSKVLLNRVLHKNFLLNLWDFFEAMKIMGLKAGITGHNLITTNPFRCQQLGWERGWRFNDIAGTILGGAWFKQASHWHHTVCLSQASYHNLAIMLMYKLLFLTLIYCILTLYNSGATTSSCINNKEGGSL